MRGIGHVFLSLSRIALTTLNRCVAGPIPKSGLVAYPQICSLLPQEEVSLLSSDSESASGPVHPPLMACCGHRGARQISPENTIASFDKALEVSWAEGRGGKGGKRRGRVG